MPYNVAIKESAYGSDATLHIKTGDAVVTSSFNGNLTVEMERYSLLQNCYIKGNLKVKSKFDIPPELWPKVEHCDIIGHIEYEGDVTFDSCFVHNENVKETEL